jgi:hypothetical protein
MTRKLLLTGVPLVAYGYGAGKSIVWYVAWRLRRPEREGPQARMAAAGGR